MTCFNFKIWDNQFSKPIFNIFTIIGTIIFLKFRFLIQSTNGLEAPISAVSSIIQATAQSCWLQVSSNSLSTLNASVYTEDFIYQRCSRERAKLCIKRWGSRYCRSVIDIILFAEVAKTPNLLWRGSFVDSKHWARARWRVSLAKVTIRCE